MTTIPTNSYATDGTCHQRASGDATGMCGQPAVWIGKGSGGFAIGYCEGCKSDPVRALYVTDWVRAPAVSLQDGIHTVPPVAASDRGTGGTGIAGTVSYLLDAHGGFTCGDTRIGVTSYAYPNSTHAIAARRRPLAVAREMLFREHRTGRPHEIDYDARNWTRLGRVALV